MLAAFLYATIQAENGTPVTAAADFQAGVFHGAFDIDVQTQMEACFKPDPTLAADIDKLMADIASKDVADAKALVMKDEQMGLDDASVCLTDPQYAAVAAAYYKQEALVEAAMADPDW